MKTKWIATTLAVSTVALVAFAMIRPANATPRRQEGHLPYLLSSGPLPITPVQKGVAPLETRVSFVLPAVQDILEEGGRPARLFITDGDFNLLLPAVQLVPEEGDRHTHRHSFAVFVTVNARQEQHMRILDERTRKIVYSGPLPASQQLHFLYVGAQSVDGKNYGPVGASVAMMGDGSVKPATGNFADGSVRPNAMKGFDPVDPNTTSIIAVLIGL